MKLGYIIEPNTKGQIVIPKDVRKKFGISKGNFLNLVVRDNGMYLHPISHVVTQVTKIDTYKKILEKTQGTWAGDDWLQTEKRQRAIELKATLERKKAW